MKGIHNSISFHLGKFTSLNPLQPNYVLEGLGSRGEANTSRNLGGRWQSPSSKARRVNNYLGPCRCATENFVFSLEPSMTHWLLDQKNQYSIPEYWARVLVNTVHFRTQKIGNHQKYWKLHHVHLYPLDTSWFFYFLVLPKKSNTQYPEIWTCRVLVNKVLFRTQSIGNHQKCWKLHHCSSLSSCFENLNTKLVCIYPSSQ